MQLRIPGPTPLPPQVRRSLARQMFNHRSEQFAQIFQEVTEGVKYFLQTKNDVFIFPGSGTGGLEAAIANSFSPGDEILALPCGEFGDRFVDIAKAFGLQVHILSFPYGKAVDWNRVKKEIRHLKKLKGVLVTHNETSTGVTNDLSSMREIVGSDCLTLVDGVSSLGAIPLPVDDWDIDITVTASQKAWMTPPGLAMLSFSERAWKAHARAKLPRYYWDVRRAKAFYEKGFFTPYTPAVTNLLGVQAALRLMKKEGRERLFARHEKLGKMVRDGILDMGLTLLADPQFASNTVTAVYPPRGMEAKDLISRLRQKHRVIVADGQGELKGKIFRVAHMGYVTKKDLVTVLKALKAVTQ